MALFLPLFILRLYHLFQLLGIFQVVATGKEPLMVWTITTWLFRHPIKRIGSIKIVVKAQGTFEIMHQILVGKSFMGLFPVCNVLTRGLSSPEGLASTFGNVFWARVEVARDSRRVQRPDDGGEEASVGQELPCRNGAHVCQEWPNCKNLLNVKTV